MLTCRNIRLVCINVPAVPWETVELARISACNLALSLATARRCCHEDYGISLSDCGYIHDTCTTQPEHTHISLSLSLSHTHTHTHIQSHILLSLIHI